MLTRTTTSFLLLAISDPGNQEGWPEFDSRYRPILEAFARRLGLGEADAADAAQEALARFVAAFREGKFDRNRGSVRSWITGIARNCIREIHDRRTRRREERGLSAVNELPADESLTRIWDEECRRSLVQHAIAELKEETRTDPRTIRAFELLALEGRTPAEVSELTGMTRNDVYLAKHRCLSRLRHILEQLQEAYEVN
jgi:RNA polymerase sigma-70 factor (ECF subfamily)